MKNPEGICYWPVYDRPQPKKIHVPFGSVLDYTICGLKINYKWHILGEMPIDKITCPMCNKGWRNQ